MYMYYIKVNSFFFIIIYIFICNIEICIVVETTQNIDTFKLTFSPFVRKTSRSPSLHQDLAITSTEGLVLFLHLISTKKKNCFSFSRHINGII